MLTPFYIYGGLLEAEGDIIFRKHREVQTVQQIKIIEANSTYQLEREVNSFLEWLTVAPIGIRYRTGYKEYEGGEKHLTHIAYIRYSPNYRAYFIEEAQRVAQLTATWGQHKG